MYGSGEMPQAFCRLCAVFGGVYNLDRPVNGLITKDDQIVGIVSRGQRIDCKFLVMNSQLCPQELKPNFKTIGIRRKICILTESSEWINFFKWIMNKTLIFHIFISVLPSPSEHLSFLSLAPKLTGLVLFRWHKLWINHYFPKILPNYISSFLFIFSDLTTLSLSTRSATLALFVLVDTIVFTSPCEFQDLFMRRTRSWPRQKNWFSKTLRR